MRRIILLASTLSLPVLVSGCAGSGFYSYLGDTFTLPGANPNIAPGNGETYDKVRHGSVTPNAGGQQVATGQTPPILYEAGDVWPPPPKAPPTLKDLQAQQAREMTNSDTSNGGFKALDPLPQLPGYEVPEQQIHVPPPTSSFPGGDVPVTHGSGVNTNGGEQAPASTSDGSIVVPNGNGTSTVIGPNGTVTTIKTPGK